MIERPLLVAAGLLLCGNTPVPPPSQDQGVAAPTTSPSGDAEADSDIIDVEFDQDRYERMTVPVTISGKGPYRFFIDTGAQATVVTRKVTDELALEPTGRARLVAMGSSEIVDTIDIDQLEFADRSFSGITPPLLERKNIGADGILGLDSLQDLRVAMDFKEDRIAVADAEQLGGNRGYEIIVRARNKLGQMIITDARVNGIRTAVIIDTGAQHSFGNPALLKRLSRRKGERDELFISDVNGVQLSSDLAYVREIAIGGVTIRKAPIGFADSPAFHALGYTDKPALILGLRNLSMFERVAIDFSSRTVLFDLPRETARPSLMQNGIFQNRPGP